MESKEKFNPKAERKNFVRAVPLFAFLAIFLVSTANVSANQMVKDKNKAAKVEQKEKEMKLETWMMDDELFEKMMLEADFCVTEESELPLEAWMLNPAMFNVKVSNNTVQLNLNEEEIDEELRLESWMLDTKEFMANYKLAVK